MVLCRQLLVCALWLSKTPGWLPAEGRGLISVAKLHRWLKRGAPRGLSAKKKAVNLVLHGRFGLATVGGDEVQR